MKVAVVKTKVNKKYLAANIGERPATMVSAKLAELPAAVRQLTGEEDAMKKLKLHSVHLSLKANGPKHQALHQNLS